MKKSRYTEERIIGIAKEHEAGVKTADVCREHGIGAATFYTWKSKFGGMDVSEPARQKPRFGYRRLHALLERRGEAVNGKRVYRVYVEPGRRCGGDETISTPHLDRESPVIAG